MLCHRQASALCAADPQIRHLSRDSARRAPHRVRITATAQIPASRNDRALNSTANSATPSPAHSPDGSATLESASAATSASGDSSPPNGSARPLTSGSATNGRARGTGGGNGEGEAESERAAMRAAIRERTKAVRARYARVKDVRKEHIPPDVFDYLRAVQEVIQGDQGGESRASSTTAAAPFPLPFPPLPLPFPQLPLPAPLPPLPLPVPPFLESLFPGSAGAAVESSAGAGSEERAAEKAESGPPRFLCPADAVPPSDAGLLPRLFFLPGIEGTGFGLQLHHKTLARYALVWTAKGDQQLGKVHSRLFEVTCLFVPLSDRTDFTRLVDLVEEEVVTCLHVPLSDRTSFTRLVDLVEEEVVREHKLNPSRALFILGESFGALLALAVSARNPKLPITLVLVNPATSFPRSPLHPLIPVLRSIPPDVYRVFPYLLSFTMAMCLSTPRLATIFAQAPSQPPPSLPPGTPMRMASRRVPLDASPLDCLLQLRQNLLDLLPILPARHAAHSFSPLPPSLLPGNPIRMASGRVPLDASPLDRLVQLRQNLLDLLPILPLVADILPQETLEWKLDLLEEGSAAVEPVLKDIKHTTLIVAGGEDQMLPSEEEAKRLHKEMAACTTVVKQCPNSGHTLLLVSAWLLWYEGWHREGDGVTEGWVHQGMMKGALGDGSLHHGGQAVPQLGAHTAAGERHGVVLTEQTCATLLPYYSLLKFPNLSSSLPTPTLPLQEADIDLASIIKGAGVYRRSSSRREDPQVDGFVLPTVEEFARSKGGMDGTIRLMCSPVFLSTVVDDARDTTDLSRVLRNSSSPSHSSHSSSSSSSARIVLGLEGIATDERPLLFVGNHQTYAPDLSPLIAELLAHGVPLRGLTHPVALGMHNPMAEEFRLCSAGLVLLPLGPLPTPIHVPSPPPSPLAPSSPLFASLVPRLHRAQPHGRGVPSFPGSIEHNPMAEEFRLFGAVPVTPKVLHRLMATDQAALLFPGGMREALRKRAALLFPGGMREALRKRVLHRLLATDQAALLFPRGMREALRKRVSGTREEMNACWCWAGELTLGGGSLHRLMATDQAALLFPGGMREALRKRGEEYKLFWPHRAEFVRMAVKFGAVIIPFASVGVDDAYNFVLDADELPNVPVYGEQIKQFMDYVPKVREDEIAGPAAERFLAPVVLPSKINRLYIKFGAPIRTAVLASKINRLYIKFGAPIRTAGTPLLSPPLSCSLAPTHLNAPCGAGGAAEYAVLPSMREVLTDQQATAALYAHVKGEVARGIEQGPCTLTLPSLTPLPSHPSGMREVLTDQQAAAALYAHVKREVEAGIEYLLRKREEDPYADLGARLLYEATWGGERQAPTFKP
ncbi:unnamed protein product [Closterium sp. Naga37s-1]|nr:unnamed protein product [Closterium sp. Naga37s-1]